VQCSAAQNFQFFPMRKIDISLFALEALISDSKFLFQEKMSIPYLHATYFYFSPDISFYPTWITNF